MTMAALRRHLAALTTGAGIGIATLANLIGPTSAFTSTFTALSLPSPRSSRRGRSVSLSRPSPAHALAARALPSTSSQPDVVVISPPGGIGEIASIEAARLGGSVKWFVVSAPSSATASSSITAETLAAIRKAGGSMELAGATADSLLKSAPKDGNDSTNGALSAMAAWCAAPKSIICTYDGAAEEKRRVDRIKTPEQIESSAGIDDEALIRSGIRVAAQAVVAEDARKIAVLAAGEEMPTVEEDNEENEGVGRLFAGLFRESDVDVPKSIAGAMRGVTSVIRHGELFGAPESSPESSPFMGGPRRDPVVRDMYTMRSVRINPTVSVSGNVLSGGEGSKSNRLAVGEVASRLGLGKIASMGSLDVALTSYAGTEAPTDEEWKIEFRRAAAMATAPGGGEDGAPLFSAEFSSVPSTQRLTEWIATKWAPAILRSYDIAGTRVGARPVYARQRDENVVEIVWQELVDFESVASGKMIIEVGERALTASRGAGDAAQGFGAISRVPLPGEDILVRRLADAASQAVGKGLAVKPKRARKKKVVTAVDSPVPAVAAAESTAPAQSVTVEPAGAMGPGPRSAGARRSSERRRGSSRRAEPPKTSKSGNGKLSP